MGCNFAFRSCMTGGGPNPDPAKFKVVKAEQVGDYHVLHVNYPNCTNFEGNKIILMPGVFNPLRDTLDPHFSESDNSPIARFKPGYVGWTMALMLAEMLAETVISTRPAADPRSRRSIEQAHVGRRPESSSEPSSPHE